MSKEPTKRKRGRPSVYKPEYAETARALCDDGATDADLAVYFGVSAVTIRTWKGKHPEFLTALKTGKEKADDRVERSLYERAVGYTFASEKVFQFQGKVVRAKTLEHVPPDSTAMIFWLKNRRPEQWRDKQDVEHSGEVKIGGLGERLDRAIARVGNGGGREKAD